MDLINELRVSQRQPKACRECTRRKVRCDKRDPCTWCVRRSTRCTRETVRMSKADTIHHDQIRFLRQLAERLETTRDVNITLADLRHRIRTLEHGPLATTEPLALVFHTEQLTPDTAKSASPGLEPSPQTDYTVSASTERPADAGEIATTQQSRKPSDNGNLQDNANTHRESGPKIDTIEFLAWGRHTGKCFPHRTCDCRSIRPYAEIVSINADLGWAGIRRTPYELPQTALLAQSEARWLVQFHLNYILWHHNVFHARTFLMQCEEFWTAGTVHHPLWAALYLSVLAVSAWSVLNSPGLQADIHVSEGIVTDLFRAMVSTLYDGNFLENPSLYPIQAITLSTRVAHNLGLSDFNATMVGAAIRMGHCLGIHRIANDVEGTGITTDEAHYLVVEAEVGRRCWLQLLIQDYFQVSFTETYMIQPLHFSTRRPRNCHDEDMIERDDQIPTINSYIRTLSRIAFIMPAFLDGLGNAQSNYSLEDAYKVVVSCELQLRAVINEIPTFLLPYHPNTTAPSTMPAWVAVARRSLSISVADKIIMIHRPVIFQAFQASPHSRTRKICVSAARSILDECAAVANTNAPSLWTHSAFCITGIMVVGLELLFRDIHTDDEASRLRAALNDTAVRLRTRKCDVIAERGVTLIDTFLEMEEQLVIKVMRLSLHGASARTVQLRLVNEIIEKSDIVAKFLALSPEKAGAQSARTDPQVENWEQWPAWLPSEFSGEPELLDTHFIPCYPPTEWELG